VAHLEEERQLAAYWLGLRAIPEHCWLQGEAADGLDWMIWPTGEISPAFWVQEPGPMTLPTFAGPWNDRNLTLIGK